MVKEHTLGLMDTSYEGEWVNGREHVQGSLIFPYWSNYVGEFKNGKKLRKKLFSGISPLSE